MPQGDKRGSDWEFYDASYDGYWNEELQRGLGQLTDGKIGSEDFKMGYYDYERSTYQTLIISVFAFLQNNLIKLILYCADQGWVGWKNESRNGQPVEIRFEFDRVREFSAVHIFTNNQFSRSVQVCAFICSPFRSIRYIRQGHGTLIMMIYV